MELSQLRYFAKAAELGNFTRAAAACDISQPSLSQQIGKLERELGRPLFRRVGRIVRLTEAGRQFHERVQQALRVIADARADLCDRDDEGRITLGAIPTIAPYHVPRLVLDFQRKFPRASVEIVEDVTAGILQRCRAGELDMALAALPLDTSGIRATELFSEELLLVTPARHRLARRKDVTLADCQNETFVLLADAHCLAGNALRVCQSAGFQPISTARVQQLATVLELVALGQGISLIPASARQNDRNPARRYRRLAGDAPRRTIALLRPEHVFESSLCRRFAAFAMEWGGRMPHGVR